MMRPYDMETLRVGTGYWHWPIVFRDARPEVPDHDYGEQGEKRLKHCSIYLPIRAIADMHADDIFEDLPDSK